MNMVFVSILLVIILGGFSLLERYYQRILLWCLAHKKSFLAVPAFIIMFGAVVWMGFSNIFGFVANGLDKVGLNIKTTSIWSTLAHEFPGMGKEFMPSLGVEPDLAPQGINGLGFDPHDLLPVFKIGAEEAVVLCRPAFRSVGPVRPDRVKDLPERHHLIRFGDRFARVLV